MLPLAAACRFVERNLARVLAPRRRRRSDRPAWLAGIDAEVRRDPWGVVLVLGAWNYPLFLPGVQSMQALAAGNAVLLKTASGAEKCAAALVALFVEAGAPSGLISVLDASEEAGRAAIECGVDHIVLTGATATGRAVLQAAAAATIPCTLELSGCDAAFVLPGADLALAADCVAVRPDAQ